MMAVILLLVALTILFSWHNAVATPPIQKALEDQSLCIHVDPINSSTTGGDFIGYEIQRVGGAVTSFHTGLYGDDDKLDETQRESAKIVRIMVLAVFARIMYDMLDDQEKAIAMDLGKALLQKYYAQRDMPQVR